METVINKPQHAEKGDTRVEMPEYKPIRITKNGQEIFYSIGNLNDEKSDFIEKCFPETT